MSSETDPLAYAIAVIESYEMDLRASAETLTTENIADMLKGKSLTEIGFCQGGIYTRALDRIRALAEQKGKP